MDVTQQIDFDDKEEASFPEVKPTKKLVELIHNESRWPLSLGTFTIGRSETCDIRLDFDSVSRRHAALTIHADTLYFIEDLGSLNKTRIRKPKGELILTPKVQYQLSEGDTVVIGLMVCEFKPVDKKPKEEEVEFQFVPPLPKKVPPPSEATQMYEKEEDFQSTQMYDATTKEVSVADATQMYDKTDVTVSEMTQAYDGEDPGLTDPTQPYPADTSLHDATQMYPEPMDHESTQAYDLPKPSKKRIQFAEATLAYDDDHIPSKAGPPSEATLAYDETPTSKVNPDATLAYEEGATQFYGNEDSKLMDPTLAYELPSNNSNSDATSTQFYGNEEATSTLAYEHPKTVKPSEAATQFYGDDEEDATATLAYEPKPTKMSKANSDATATQFYGDEEETKSIEATLAYEETKPVGAKGESVKSISSEAATQFYGDDDVVTKTHDATLAYDTAPAVKAASYENYSLSENQSSLARSRPDSLSLEKTDGEEEALVNKKLERKTSHPKPLLNDKEPNPLPDKSIQPPKEEKDSDDLLVQLLNQDDDSTDEDVPNAPPQALPPPSPSGSSSLTTSVSTASPSSLSASTSMQPASPSQKGTSSPKGSSVKHSPFSGRPASVKVTLSPKASEGSLAPVTPVKPVSPVSPVKPVFNAPKPSVSPVVLAPPIISKKAQEKEDAMQVEKEEKESKGDDGDGVHRGMSLRDSMGEATQAFDSTECPLERTFSGPGPDPKKRSVSPAKKKASPSASPALDNGKPKKTKKAKIALVDSTDGFDPSFDASAQSDPENSDDEYEEHPKRRTRSIKEKSSTVKKRKTRRQSSASPVRHSPRRDRRHQPRVLFTGISDPDREEALLALGATIANSPQQCTHVVTDKIHRTVKFLTALCIPAVFVHYDWVDACEQAGEFVEERPYLLNDKAYEQEHNFSLKASLDRAATVKLLEDLKFYITVHVKPLPAVLKDLIKASEGTVLTRLPVKYHEENIILSCEEDLEKAQHLAKLGYTIYTPEFLLSGILHQKLEYDKNVFITPDNLNPQPSPQPQKEESVPHPKEVIKEPQKEGVMVPFPPKAPASPPKANSPSKAIEKSPAQASPSTPSQKASPTQEPCEEGEGVSVLSTPLRRKTFRKNKM